MQGNVFHIQRFSLFDGPGVRTIVFLKGCPLRCIWCHNPEGMKKEPQILFNPDKCISCGACITACPQHLHMIENERHIFSRNNCRNCGKCTEECYSNALSAAGQLMDVDTVMEQVLRDLPVYQESAGGMTLSGGEPFFQPEFSIALLKEAKQKGISTCVETCGYVNEQIILEAAKYTDYFYYDYKATGDNMHKKLCGVSQQLILNNLTNLDEAGANVTLRCPIIPGQNDTPEHIQGIARIASIHSSIKEIHLEPYHKLGVSKAQSLGRKDIFNTSVPQHDDMEAYRKEIQFLSSKNCIIN